MPSGPTSNMLGVVHRTAQLLPAFSAIRFQQWSFAADVADMAYKQELMRRVARPLVGLEHIIGPTIGGDHVEIGLRKSARALTYPYDDLSADRDAGPRVAYDKRRAVHRTSRPQSRL